MSDDFPEELKRELLDDFYTECDELFGQIRTHLGALEQRSGDANADRNAIESLYRSVHSFKGICGIVGLRLAEELAHAAEDVLRSVSREESVLTPEALELFARSTHRLEQIVTAHRLHQPLPDIADLLAPLQAFRPAPSAAPRPNPSAGRPESEILPPPTTAAEPTPAANWRATFSPSADLDRRGVNVTSVRQRLASLGAITQAAPCIRADGTMTFEFNIAARQPLGDLAPWNADGIVLQPLESAAARSAQPETAVAGPDAPGALSIAPSHIVRVDLGRLDDLMRIMGEMVIHRSRLEERIANLPGDRTALQEVNLALGRSLRDLRGAITRVRLVPVAEIFTRLPYVVRDLARETGRKVRLVLEGRDTEIDKYLVERLKEPLLHLVRNAISHGIETPEERLVAGKPSEATLTLRASAAGHTVVIEIRDDGRGMDAKKILARAAALGLPVPDSPTDADLLALICQPGFSTRDEADLAAGRGVGMAVVHNTVRELGGLLSFETEPGAFTKFTLRLPLTLSIADTFIVSTGGQTCAVPQGFIEEIVQFEEHQVRTVKSVEVIPYRDGLLPLVRLGKILGVEARTRVRIPALVINSERGCAGLVVDRVQSQREVVVRPMADPLLQVRGISGATELGDGRPVLILDPAALTSGAVRPRSNGEATRMSGRPVERAAQAS